MIRSTRWIFARLGTAAAVLVLLASAPAGADQIYDFTFTGNGGMNATGTITVSGGPALSGTIDATGVPIEADPSTLLELSGSLIPGNGSNQDIRDHDGDVITIDNLVNLANDPILTGNGLGFGSGQYAPSQYLTIFNIWGDSPGQYTLFVGEASLNPDGTVLEAQYVYAFQNGSLTLTPVSIPEPSTFVLAGLGLMGLGIARWRKRNRRT